MTFMYIALCTPHIRYSGIRNAKTHRYADPRMDKGGRQI